MPTLLRPGTSCPCLTSLDKLTHGSLPQDPSLTKLRDGTDASTHRNAVSKPRRPSQQGSDAGALPRADPPLRPPHTGRGCHASHHTMPSAASPSISMHAEHGPCQAGPASPSIDADDTDAAPPPTPGCRLKDRHPYSRSRIAAPPLRVGARATGRVCMLRRGQAPCQAMPSEAPVPARRHDPTLSATTLAPWWTGPLHGRPRGRCAALVVGRGRLTHESPPPKGRDK